MPGLEIDGDEAKPLGDAESGFSQTLPLPRLRPGLIHLEDVQAMSDLGTALGESIEACAQDYVLGYALLLLFFNKVLDKSGASYDGRAHGL